MYRRTVYIADERICNGKKGSFSHDGFVSRTRSIPLNTPTQRRVDFIFG